MEMRNVVAIYVDSAKWMEFEIELDIFEPELLAFAIMNGWLKETAYDDDPYNPNWEKEEDWSMVGFYGDENNACYTAIFSPYRGERVTFVFFT